eukprot:5606931-Alexandrium_andersonii.AAC.1
MVSPRAAGHTLSTHHIDFAKRSGVPETGGVAREHQHLCECLRLLATHDQLDGAALARMELFGRRL